MLHVFSAEVAAVMIGYGVAMSQPKAGSTVNHDLPKHRQVYRRLEEAIAEGIYGPGARLPTETELVQELGVSRSTVVRALRDLQQDGLVERRRGSGSYVRVREPVERKTFGIIVSGLFPDANPGNNIFSQIFGEMSRVGGERNCVFLVGNTPDERDIDVLIDRTVALAERYVEERMDGVFFMPLMLSAERMSVNERVTGILDEAGIPVVLLDRDLYGYPRRSGYDLVGIDNLRAGWVLTRHLLQNGCRRIDFIASKQMKSTISARTAGYRMALRESGIEPDPAWVHQGSESDLEFIHSVVKRAKTDAFVCEHDGVAMVMIREILSLGIGIPDDVRVVGFDGSPLGEHLPVPLTTMRQPTEHIATVAVNTMLERVDDACKVAGARRLPERTITLTAKLIVRESCGGNGLQGRRR